MIMASAMGLISLLFTILIPVLLLVLILKILKNGETQVEQNQRIIELLEKGENKNL